MIPAINSVKLALISTGIGAIVVGLGVAFGALTSYFNGTVIGGLKLKEMFAYMSGAATALMNRIRFLGSAIFSLFTGDIEGFKKGIADAFSSGFFDEVISKSKENNALAKEQTSIQLEKNKLRLDELNMQVEVARLNEIARNTDEDNKESLDKRLAAAKRLQQINDEFNRRNEAILKREYDVTVAINALGDNNQEDYDNEYNAAKALADFQVKAYDDRVTQNKVIAKLQREGAKDDKEISSERLKEAKEYGVELKSNIELTKNLFDDKGKIKKSNKPNVEKLDTKALDKYQEKIYQSATHQQYLFDSGKTGWQKIGEQITNTQYIAETFGNAINGLSDAFEGLFEGTAGGFKNVVTSMLEGLRTIINGLMAQAIAGLIAKETSSKGIVGLVTASIGLSALIGLWKSKVPAFTNGGIVGGTSFTGDKISANLNSGEMILNKSQQANLFAMANGSGYYGGEVRFEIEGNKLVGVLNNHNKKVRNTR